jgi:hypothetical protein
VEVIAMKGMKATATVSAHSMAVVERTGIKQTSKQRIISVEQKMQRTAAQKLAAERLVLGRGIFDMGSSMKNGDGDGMTAAGKLGY